METLKDYNETLQRRAQREMAWEILSKNFTTRAPRRFVSGVALSSNQKNANGKSFDASGTVALEIPLPCLWNHEWHRPIGKVTAVKVKGDQLFFDAELCNSGLRFADDAWHGLAQRLNHGASVGMWLINPEDEIDGHYRRSALHEISIAPEGADPGARILKVWERSNVVYINRSSETIHWSESE